MGVVLIQQSKPICYHYEIFTQEIFDYPIYDKELYASVESVEK